MNQANFAENFWNIRIASCINNLGVLPWILSAIGMRDLKNMQKIDIKYVFFAYNEIN